MKTKLVTLLLAAMLTACANDGSNGLNGAPGVNGNNGSDGQPAFAGVQAITVTSVRTYGSGSSITDGSAILPAGIVQLPLVIQVTSGNAGNGWVTVMIGETRFCYQGTAPNTTIISGQFALKGFKIGSNCDTGGATPVSNTFTIFNDTPVLVSLLGGGCGSNCQTTAVDVVLNVNRFN